MQGDDLKRQQATRFQRTVIADGEVAGYLFRATSPPDHRSVAAGDVHTRRGKACDFCA